MDRTVAIVAPQWLQDGLAVVIKSIPGVHLVACTGSIHILLSLDLERAPDVVVLTVDVLEIKASDQIRQVKFVYPRHAPRGLNSGASPERQCTSCGGGRDAAARCLCRTVLHGDQPLCQGRSGGMIGDPGDPILPRRLRRHEYGVAQNKHRA